MISRAKSHQVRQQVLAMTRVGAGRDAIASKLGISIGQVAYYRREPSIEPAKKINPPPVRLPEDTPVNRLLMRSWRTA